MAMSSGGVARAAVHRRERLEGEEGAARAGGILARERVRGVAQVGEREVRHAEVLGSRPASRRDDREEACRLGRREAVGGILEGHGVLGRQAERRKGEPVDVRRGLLGRHHVPAGDDREAAVRALAELGVQERGHVRGGRRRGDAHAHAGDERLVEQARDAGAKRRAARRDEFRVAVGLHAVQVRHVRREPRALRFGDG